MNKNSLCPIILLLMISTPLRAEEIDPPAPEQSVQIRTVTSLQKCLDQLGAKDAIDIQSNYMKPWQECQRRLEEKLEKEQAQKVQEAKEATTPITPRNYIRIQQPKKAESEKSTAPGSGAK